MIAVYAKRAWLDGIEETVAHFTEYGNPTRVERFVPQYFHGWVTQMRELEKEKMKHRPEEEDITSFKGFGKAPNDGEDTEDMEQFYDFIEWTLAGHVE